MYFSSTDEIEVKDEESDFNFDGLPEENRASYIREALEKLPQVEYTLL